MRETWLPPREQQPPHQWAPPGPGTAASTSYDTVSDRAALPAARPDPAVRRAPAPATSGGAVLPGWLWPVVSVLALMVGVIGGVVGGAAYENWHSQLPRGPGRRRPGRRRHGLAGTAPGRQPLGGLGRAAAAAEHDPGARRSTRARRTARPAPASSSTARGTTSPTTTWSPTRSATTGRSRSSTRTATRYPATVVGRSPTYDLAVLYVKDGPTLPPAQPRHRRGAPRRRPGRRVRLAARAQLARSPPASSAR